MQTTILAGVKPLEEAYRAPVQSCRIEVTAERNILPADGLPKLVGVRTSQMKRVIMRADENGETQHISIHLARVSSNDINVATARLRREPGVHLVKVDSKTRRQNRAAE